MPNYILPPRVICWSPASFPLEGCTTFAVQSSGQFYLLFLLSFPPALFPSLFLFSSPSPHFLWIHSSLKILKYCRHRVFSQSNINRKNLERKLTRLRSIFVDFGKMRFDLSKLSYFVLLLGFSLTAKAHVSIVLDLAPMVSLPKLYIYIYIYLLLFSH